MDKNPASSTWQRPELSRSLQCREFPRNGKEPLKGQPPYIALSVIVVVATIAGVLLILLFGTIARDYHAELPHGSLSEALQYAPR